MAKTGSPDAIYDVLITLGLSIKEVRVYLALLETGQTTVARVARRAGINRTTAYDILNSLEEKELVVALGKEPKQEYKAESPDQLEKLLQARLKRTQYHLELAHDLVPQLKSMHVVGDRPVVRFYEGEEGLKHVYEDTLTSHEPIRAYASVENMHAGLPGYFPKYYKRRADAGIKIKAIIPNTDEGRERAMRDKIELRESALVPVSEYSFSPEINIYDNKVMIASWREKLGITIESKEIADAMKKIFELSWAEAKRLHQMSHKKSGDVGVATARDFGD